MAVITGQGSDLIFLCVVNETNRTCIFSSLVLVGELLVLSLVEVLHDLRSRLDPLGLLGPSRSYEDNRQENTQETPAAKALQHFEVAYDDHKEGLPHDVLTAVAFDPVVVDISLD